MTLAHTLAYYDTARIMVVKSFITHAHKSLKYFVVKNQIEGFEQGILKGEVSLYH